MVNIHGNVKKVISITVHVLRGKIQIYFYAFFEFLQRKTLHSSSYTIESHRDYLFDITM